MALEALTEPRYIAHPDPVWREQSNFLLHARVGPDAPDTFEQLWARRVGPDRFEVCCIPFAVYGISLGDVVHALPDDEGRQLVGRVVQPSGRQLFRVWFGASDFPPERIANKLVGLGAVLEWCSPNLLAVDVVPRRASYVASFLRDRQRLGQLTYESGSD